MADTENAHVAALLRKRSHLMDTADLAKRQEVDEQLRLAGVNPDDVEEPKEAKREAPHERTETAEQPAKRGPGRPRKDGSVTGSGGLTLPKASGKA